MTAYNGNGSGATGLPGTISARSLPNAHLSKAERAILGADIVDGRAFLQGLTIRLVAIAVGCSVGSVFAALRLTPEQREAVKRGQRPLVLPQPRTPSTAFDWTKVDDETLTNTVRQVGIERVLEAAAAVERVAIIAHV